MPTLPDLYRFLTILHGDGCRGLEERQRAFREALPAIRSLYSWQAALGERLVYFPSVRVEALGLRYLHLLFWNPLHEVPGVEYAVAAHWLSPLTGDAVLYLRLLVPTSHLPAVLALLPHDRDPLAVRVFSTGTGWQVLQELDKVLDRAGRIAHPSPSTPPVRMLEEHDDEPPFLLREAPLSLAVVAENLERRLSPRSTWRRITAHLGDQVWRYLPRRKRLPKNGMTYVVEILRLLDRTGVFRQNIVRYQPLRMHAREVYLVTPPLQGEALAALMRDLLAVAPDVEAFPAADGRSLLRIVGDLTLLDKLIEILPRHRPAELLLLDPTKTPPAVRFQYERLFDPATRTWRPPPNQLVRGAL